MFLTIVKIMDDVTTRLKKVINWLIFQEIAENERALSELLGYTKSSFSQIINGKVPLSDKFVTALCSLDKNINEIWIKTGEGQMFLDNISISQKVYGDNNHVAGRDLSVSSQDVNKLIDTVNRQQATISELIQANQSQMDKFMDILDRLTK